MKAEKFVITSSGRILKSRVTWLLVSLLCIISVGAQQAETFLYPFSKQKPYSEAYHLALNELAWVNPSPGIEDLGISLADLKSLVGDRIVLMIHPPRDVDVPYYGDMVRWHNARFVSAVTEIPMSADKLRQMIIDNDQKDGWKDIEPFVRATSVLYKQPATKAGALEQVGLHYKIRANISIIRVNGNFYVRNSYEDVEQTKHNSITSLFLTGDLGVSLGVVPIIPKSVLSPLAVANVRRWEFIDIGEDRSLVVITDWSEVMNDTDLSKHMSQYDEGAELGGLTDEELVGPYPAVAGNMHNFKQTVLNYVEGAPGKVSTVPRVEKATVPDFVHGLPKQALAKVLPNGPVLFMHPGQRVAANYGDFPMHFVTAVYGVNATFDELRGLSSQMDNYAKFVPQIESSILTKGSFDLPDFTLAADKTVQPEVDLSLNLGRKMKFISSFKLEYRLRYQWERPDRLGFEAIGGDIETVQGALEWMPDPLDAQHSLLFYTVASDLGHKPKFPLNMTQKIPGADIASGVIISAMFVGRQGPWVEKELGRNEQPSDEQPSDEQPSDEQPSDEQPSDEQEQGHKKEKKKK